MSVQDSFLNIISAGANALLLLTAHWGNINRLKMEIWKNITNKTVMIQGWELEAKRGMFQNHTDNPKLPYRHNILISFIIPRTRSFTQKNTDKICDRKKKFNDSRDTSTG